MPQSDPLGYDMFKPIKNLTAAGYVETGKNLSQIMNDPNRPATKTQLKETKKSLVGIKKKLA